MTERVENNKSVAIVIAVKNFNANLEQNIIKCLELDYPNFEIIVLPDDISKNTARNAPARL